MNRGIVLAAKSQPAPSLSAIWRRIDRVYCISLADRRDRQAGAAAQFARVGLAERVEFHLARRHPSDCEQGIFESHCACLQLGLDAGARHILVFEDDVIFGKIDGQRLSDGIDYFIESEDYPLLFLGGIVDGSWPTDNPAVRKVRYRCLAHAYLIKAALARRIAGQSWAQLPIDGLLRRCTPNHLALYPSIAFQSGSPSDNSRHRTLDTIRRLLGGLRLIQLANERYHRHRHAVIAAHVLVLSALILWILT